MKTIIVTLLFIGAAVFAEAVEGCVEDPCMFQVCRHHHTARCRFDARKVAVEWYDEHDDKLVVDCDKCPNDDAQDCEEADHKCFSTPCNNFPDAPVCRMYNCGQCTPEYFNLGSNDPLDCWA